MQTADSIERRRVRQRAYWHADPDRLRNHNLRRDLELRAEVAA